MAIIRFDNASYSYDGAQKALDGITLDIPEGQFLCVLGGNGSGKSTFAKHINALLIPDSGTVSVLDADTADAHMTYFIRSNAGMVFQNPDDQLVSSIIEDDVAFGPENMGIVPSKIRELVTESLRAVGLQGFEKRTCASLSGGQKQRVAIAGVLAMDPRILILDEASAMLDPRGRHGLIKACKSLNERGLTIVYITHFMDEVVQADRVIVLDNGRIALDGTPEQILVRAAELENLALDVPFSVRMGLLLRHHGFAVPLRTGDDGIPTDIISSLRQRELPLPRSSFAAQRTDKDDPVIKFEHVSYTYNDISEKNHPNRSAADSSSADGQWGNSPDSYWALRGISLELHKGEMLGIAGHTGSGKSTLIQLANGLLKPTSGRVIVYGQDISSKKEAIEARRNVGLVFQYPEHQLFASTVFDDVAFGPRNLGLNAKDVEKRVCESLRMVHLDPDDLRNRNPFALSGGQQRRVAFAGVLAMDPNVLILDEPAAGLDPQARSSFMQLILELHEREGISIIIVSHDMDALGEFCDRLIVLNRGEIAFEGTPAHVFSQAEELHAIGLGIPHTTNLINTLAGHGIALPPSFDGIHSPTPEQLADALSTMR